MRPHTRPSAGRFLLLALTALPLLGGCDLFAGDDGCLIEARGRAVLAGSGQPIAGLGVSLAEAGGLGGVLVVDSDRTGGDGRFSLTFDTRRSRGTAVTTTIYSLTVNDEPYDGRYTVYRNSVFEAGECSVDFGTVELSLNPTP